MLFNLDSVQNKSSFQSSFEEFICSLSIITKKETQQVFDQRNVNVYLLPEVAEEAALRWRNWKPHFRDEKRIDILLFSVAIKMYTLRKKINILF